MSVKTTTPLEALEKINEIILPYNEAKQSYLRPRDVCQNEFIIIETALKENEYLRFIIRCKDVKELDNAKKLKVLEIIKEKADMKTWLTLNK